MIFRKLKQGEIILTRRNHDASSWKMLCLMFAFHQNMTGSHPAKCTQHCEFHAPHGKLHLILLSIPRVRTPPSLLRVSLALSSIRNLFRQSVSIFSRNILPLICCDLCHIFGSKYLEANDTQEQTHIYFGVSGTTTTAEDSILCGPFLS